MYTTQWFKEKFEKIDNWRTGNLNRDGKSCALGHCGVTHDASGWYTKTEEATALAKIFRTVFPGCIDSDEGIIFSVNDNISLFMMGDERIFIHSLGTTPKARIMRVLEMAEEIENKAQIEANLEYAAHPEELEYV